LELLRFELVERALLYKFILDQPWCLLLVKGVVGYSFVEAVVVHHLVLGGQQFLGYGVLSYVRAGSLRNIRCRALNCRRWPIRHVQHLRRHWPVDLSLASLPFLRLNSLEV